MSKTKKIIFSASFLIVFFAVIWAVLPVGAADLPTLTFKAVKNGETVKSVSAGDTFEVEADFAEKFNMFDLNVTYDKDLFELTKEEIGVDGISNMTEKGVYYLNYSTSKVGGNAASDGKVFILTFKVKDNAESGKKGAIALNFETPFKLNDEAYQPQIIDYKLVDELKDGLTIAEKQIDSIAVKTKPAKVTYKEGGKETLDLSGGVIQVTYTDKSTKDIAMTDKAVSAKGFDVSKAGKNTITLSYGGKSCQFDVTIEEKSVASIIIMAPKKTSYYQDSDETLDLTGGVVKVTYDNGEQEDVAMDNASVNVSGYNNSKAGKNTLTVTYGGKSGTFDVTIVAKAVTGISVNTLPSKTAYIQDEDVKNLDLTGGKIDVQFNNGKKETLKMTDAGVSVSGFDTSVLGVKTLTVAYNDGTKDWTCTFDVTITVKGIVSISMEKAPEKVTYLEGKDALDLTGGAIKVAYDNGKTDILSMTAEGVSVTGFDNTKPGKQTLTVNYGGKTCTFKVTVTAKSIDEISVEKLPDKTVYVQNNEQSKALNLEGGVIKVQYDNDTAVQVNMTDDGVTATGYDYTKPGQQTVILTYGGKTATFFVTVMEIKVEDPVIEHKAISEEKQAVYTKVVEEINIVAHNTDKLEEAVQITVSEDEIDAACQQAGIDKTNAKVVYEPVFRIELNEESSPLPDADGKLESFSVEITPAVTVKIVSEGEDKETILEEKEVKLEEVAIDISVPLTEAFLKAVEDNNEIYVQHDAVSGQYEYVAKVEDGRANFTSEHGCSPFVLSVTSQAAAEVDNTRYINFEDALKAGIETGKAITLFKDVDHVFTKEEISDGISFVIDLNDHKFTYSMPEGYEMREEKNGQIVKYTASKKDEHKADEPVKPADSKGTQVNTGITTQNTSVYLAAAFILIALLIAIAVVWKKRESHSQK